MAATKGELDGVKVKEEAEGPTEAEVKIFNTACALLEKHRFKTMKDTGEIYVYDAGKYRPEAGLIGAYCEGELTAETSRRLVKEVMGHIERYTYTDRSSFDADLDLINFPNGLYRISTGKLLTHTPDYLSLVQQPFDYDATKTATEFEKFLNEVLYAEEIEPMLDTLAYTFYRAHVADILNILIGAGANGKTVLGEVLTALHGPALVSHRTLKDIMGNRFAKADLEGKNVNWTSETARLTYADTAALKEITKPGLQNVERKGIQGYSAVLWAKIWSATNIFPEFDDDSDGMHRRLNLFDFPNQFEGEKEDPDLTAKLTTPAMLAGIFNLLAPRLKRIAAEKKIIMARKTIAERRRQVQLAKNPLEAFQSDCLREPTVAETLAKEDYETKDNMHRAFLIWCGKNKVPKLSEDAFGRAMKNALNCRDDKVSIDGKRVRVWQGIKLSEDSKVSLEQFT